MIHHPQNTQQLLNTVREHCAIPCDCSTIVLDPQPPPLMYKLASQSSSSAKVSQRHFLAGAHLLGRASLLRGTSSTDTPQLAPPYVRLSSKRARSFSGSVVGALHVKSWQTYAVALA